MDYTSAVRKASLRSGERAGDTIRIEREQGIYCCCALCSKHALSVVAELINDVILLYPKVFQLSEATTLERFLSICSGYSKQRVVFCVFVAVLVLSVTTIVNLRPGKRPTEKGPSGVM